MIDLSRNDFPYPFFKDNVRFRFPWSGHLHYVNPVDDYPPKHCTFGENGWTSEENVLTGELEKLKSSPRLSFLNLPNSSNISLIESSFFLSKALTNYTSRVVTSTGYDRDVALRFLVHFVGDLHQPLHLTGRNRGGNDVKVHFEGRLNKLHSVWDSQIIHKQLRELSNYTTKLPSYRIESALQNKPYDSYIRWILKEGLGQPASNDVDSWWDQEEIEDWLKCPDQEKVEGWGSANQFVMGLKDFVGIKSLTDNVDKTDLPICPLHWSRKMHPLVCSYAFASPVPIDENIPPYPELDVPEYLGRIDR